MPRKHLTDSQLYVLNWIAQGCPEGVFPEDQHSHKISARALANRGLVKIRRAGGWNATLTDAGRFYNEHGHYPLPKDAPVRAKIAAARNRPRPKPALLQGEPLPPRPKPPAEELVAKVLDAGGVLVIPDRADWSRAQQLVHSANRYRKTPTGTRLYCFHSQLRGQFVQLLSLPGWTPEWESPIPVRDRLGRVHPVVATLRESGLSAFPSGPSRTRVTRILNVLAWVAESRGYVVRPKPARVRGAYGYQRQDPSLFLLETPNVTLGINLRRLQTQVPAPEGSWHSVDLVPTDRLLLTLTGASYDGTTWSDSDRTGLESRLHEVLLRVALEEAAAIVKAELQREADEARIQREAEQAELRRRAQEEKAREDRLLGDVRGWRLAQEIRAFLKAAQEADSPVGESDRDWFAWIEEYADKVDPLVGRSPS